MNIAVWSEIGVETDRSGLPIDLPLLVRLRPSLRLAARAATSGSAARPQEVAEHCDVLSVHLALNDKTRGLVERRRARPPEAGLVLRQHGARRGGRLRGARAGGAGRRSCAWRSTSTPRSRRRARPTSTSRCSRCPTSTARTTSAPRPTRRRRRSPPRRCASSRPSSRPGACSTSSTCRARRRRSTCSSCATATSPACSPSVFDALRDEQVNVQETENIVFTGAQAAVARINLDAEPSDAALRWPWPPTRHPRRPGRAAQRPRLVAPPRQDARTSSRRSDPMSSTMHHRHPRPQLLRRAAVLPLPVLEEVQRDMLALPGVGMSILEVSHRSKTFEAIIQQAEADIRDARRHPGELPRAVPAGRRQPAVLDGADEPADRRRDRRLHRHRRLGQEGGQGGQARRHGQRRRDDRGRQLQRGSRRRASSSSRRAPPTSTSPRTRRSTACEWKAEPEVGDVPLVCDTSSDMFSRPIDVAKYALIYAGAQKNLGPAGVTLVIVRDDMLSARPRRCRRCSTTTRTRRRSRSTTRRRASRIYILGLVLKWVKANGGLAAMARAQRAQGREALRRDRPHRASTAATRDEGMPVEHERHVPAAERGPREAVRRRSRRPPGSTA